MEIQKIGKQQLRLRKKGRKNKWNMRITLE